MESLGVVLLSVGAGLLGLVLLLALLDRATRRRPISLQGKHVLIVGGSSGIGLALAELALGEGASVSIIARSAKKLLEAQEQLSAVAARRAKRVQAKAGAVAAISADASNFKDMERAVREAMAACGPIQAVICCQGVCRPHTFRDWDLDAQREHMEANYWGTVHALKAGALESVCSDTAHGTGRIMLVSSQAGQCGVYGYTAYAASKFALRGLAECLQQEVLPWGVRVSMLFPPDTDTPQLAEESKTKTAITKEISAQSGPPMKAADVAAAGLAGMKRGDFLVSANLTGFMLNVCTAGMAPAASIMSFVMEVLLAGLMRVVAILTLLDFDRIIWQNAKARAGPTKTMSSG